MANVDCPRCARPNEPGARFCEHCGAGLAPRVHCPACNQLQALGARFCTSCGATMRDAGPHVEGGAASGAVVDGVWQRGDDEFIRRVDPEDTRTFLGNRVVRVPPGTVGVVVVGAQVERLLPPGERTTATLFERVTGFFTGRGGENAFYLADLRPIPIPFTVQTRPTAGGRTVQTQVLATFRLPRGDKDALGAFITNVLGSRSGYAAGDLYDLLRPDVTRAATAVLERLAREGEVRYVEAESEVRAELAALLGARYGLEVDVSLAPLASTASIDVRLGTGVAPRLRQCAACQAEVPAAVKFCEACGHRQPTLTTPDRRCAGCAALVPDGDRFCNGCGQAYTAPPAEAAPLFTADGEQVEVDLVVRVQGAHEDFGPATLAPALAAGTAAHLRDVAFADLSTAGGFSALEAALQADVTALLASHGLQLLALSVVDVRSKSGQWVLGARADLERTKAELEVNREWFAAAAKEIEIAELGQAHALRRQQVERDARFAERQAALDDRRRAQAQADAEAALDAADARRAADREVAAAQARRTVEGDARAGQQSVELDALRHDMTKERTTAEHEAALTREAMALETEKRRQQVALQSEAARQAAEDAAFAARARSEAELDARARGVDIDQQVADRDQARQLEKLQAMADIDREMAEQEAAEARARIESLKGLSEREMIAAQAAELAKSEGGGAAWAQALSGQDVAKAKEEELARMQSLTERVLTLAGERQRDAGAAQVVGQALDAMGRVAAAKAAPAPVVAVPAAVETVKCAACGATGRADARFCGECGASR